MPDLTVSKETWEFSLLLRRLIRSRTRLTASMPEHLLAARARLVETYRGGKTNRASDYELLFRIGELLANRPESISMGELSRDLHVPLSTATRIVDWLVRGDYAQRLPDPDDRRVVRVALSPTGQQVYQVAQQVIHDRVDYWLRSFGPEEKVCLNRLVRKFVEAMEEE